MERNATTYAIRRQPATIASGAFRVIFEEIRLLVSSVAWMIRTQRRALTFLSGSRRRRRLRSCRFQVHLLPEGFLLVPSVVTRLLVQLLQFVDFLFQFLFHLFGFQDFFVLKCDDQSQRSRLDWIKLIVPCNSGSRSNVASASFESWWSCTTAQWFSVHPGQTAL